MGQTFKAENTAGGPPQQWSPVSQKIHENGSSGPAKHEVYAQHEVYEIGPSEREHSDVYELDSRDN